MRIRNKLEPPRIHLTHPTIRVGEELPITIHSTPSLGSCLSLDFGNGVQVGWRAGAQCEGKEEGREKWKAAPLSSILTSTHKYSEPGTYSLVVRVFSAAEETETRETIEVLGALPCTVLNVWVQKNGSLEAPLKMKRADKLWVRSFAEVNCSVSKLDMEISKCW